MWKNSNKFSKTPTNFLVKLKECFFSQEIWNIIPRKQANSIQISYNVEDATKTISKLRRFEHQTRNHLKTKFCLENRFFVPELQENLLYGISLSLRYCFFKFLDNRGIPLTLFSFRKRFHAVFAQRNNSSEISTFENGFLSGVPICVILK